MSLLNGEIACQLWFLSKRPGNERDHWVFVVLSIASCRGKCWKPPWSLVEKEEEGSRGAGWSRGWSLWQAGKRMCDGGECSWSGRCVKNVELKHWTRHWNRDWAVNLDLLTMSCLDRGVHECGSPLLARPTLNTPGSQTEWLSPSPPAAVTLLH